MATVCPTRSVTLALSPGLRRYKVTYRVDLDSTTAGGIGVINALGQQLFVSTYSYGPETDPLAWLVEIGVPRRAGGDKLLDRWLVDCTYEFDQSQRPEFQGVIVEPFYIGSSEPIVSAYYNGAFEQVGDNLQPIAQAGQSFELSYRGPISNSARIPIVPVPERDKSTPAYRVKWVRNRADFNFEFYINSVNTVAFALVGFNRLITDLTAGVVYNTYLKAFAPGTLRLRDVQISPVQYYSRDAFEHTLEFVEDQKDLIELDRGTAARADIGDADGRGGTYSSGDFPEGTPQVRDILDASGNPITEPVLLNGRGKPLDAVGSARPVYLTWLKYEGTNFNDLPIGVP